MKRLSTCLFAMFCFCFLSGAIQGFRNGSLTQIKSLAVGKSTATTSTTAFEVGSTQGGLVSIPCPAYVSTSSASVTAGACMYNTTTGKINVSSASAWAEVGSSTGAGGIFAGGQNLLSNNSWETDSTLWSATAGIYTRTTATQHIIPPGVGAAAWDSAALGDIFSNTAVTITAGDGVSYRNIVGSVSAKCGGAANTCAHVLEVFDSSAAVVLNSVAITFSSVSFTRTSVNAIAPSTATLQLRTRSMANEPVVYEDDSYLGLAEGFNISSFAQGQFAGKSYFATTANCSAWSRTNTAIGVLASDTDCPGPTIEVQKIGSWQTTDADLPQQTINNLPPGVYLVYANFTSNSSGSNITEWAISDGTTTSGRSAGSDATAETDNPAVVGYFEYTTAGNRTFAVHCSASASACTILNNVSNEQLEFTIVRYPLANEQAYTTDNADYGWTLVTVTNTWTTNTTTTAYERRVGDSAYYHIKVATAGAPDTATLTITLPTGRVIDTTKIPGGAPTDALYFWSATGGTVNSGARAQQICGIYKSTTAFYVGYDDGGGNCAGLTQAAPFTYGATDYVDFIVGPIPIVGWATTNRAPQLVNSVLNTSSGATRVEAALLNCDSAAAITSQHGSWISSIGNIASGACAITLTSGTFAAQPYCWISENGAATTTLERQTVTPSSATAVSIDCSTAAIDCTSFDVSLMCMGAK